MQLPNLVGLLAPLLGRSCTPTTSGFNNQTAIEFSFRDCPAQNHSVSQLTSQIANATNLCNFYLSGTRHYAFLKNWSGGQTACACSCLLHEKHMSIPEENFWTAYTPVPPLSSVKCNTNAQKALQKAVKYPSYFCNYFVHENHLADNILWGITGKDLVSACECLAISSSSSSSKTLTGWHNSSATFTATSTKQVIDVKNSTKLPATSVTTKLPTLKITTSKRTSKSSTTKSSSKPSTVRSTSNSSAIKTSASTKTSVTKLTTSKPKAGAFTTKTKSTTTRSSISKTTPHAPTTNTMKTTTKTSMHAAT